MIRITHQVVQGSPEWDALRATCFTASEAPAMAGVSKYQSRSDLLKQKATGVKPEIDEHTQRRFDAGHAAEAAARPIVEGRIGDELFPVTMSVEIDGLKLLASLDGMTMLGDVIWENKLLNDGIVDDIEQGQIHDQYAYQIEQQLLVSGADRCYFTTSDGTPEGTFGMWYQSVPEVRERLIAGWKQFAKDLAEYVPQSAETEKPIGHAPETLPALRIEVTGMVTASNLDAFKSHALTVFKGIKTDLQTDADFADAEKTVKWCSEVEGKLEAAKSHALSQTASIDELFRTIDSIKEEARAVRLKLDKLVKSEKEARKLQIVTQAQQALVAHVAALNIRLGGNYMPAHSTGLFGEAIKGLKSLDSMRDKVSVVLANAKVGCNEIADRIEANRKTVEDMSLCPDFAQICTKAPDDFAATILVRINARKEAEERRLEAERQRIRTEEEAKAQRAAREAQAEMDRQNAVARAAEQAKLDAERAELQRQQAALEANRQRDEAAKSTKPAEQPAVEPTPAPAESEAKVTLGQINAVIAPVQISAAGLTQIGIQSVGRDRSAVLYRESDVPRICAALIRHLSALPSQQKQAA